MSWMLVLFTGYDRLVNFIHLLKAPSVYFNLALEVA